jgi:hypothetical protein
MDRLPLVDAERDRRYLLEKTQHIIGGFGKGVGEPPGTAARRVLRKTANSCRPPAFVFWDGRPRAQGRTRARQRRSSALRNPARGAAPPVAHLSWASWRAMNGILGMYAVSGTIECQ